MLLEEKMKKILLSLILVLSLVACQNEVINENTTEGVMPSDVEAEETVEYQKISPEEAKTLMVDGNLILDVRTQGEFDEGHIKDAVLLDVQDIINENVESLTDKEQVILVYCRSGNRSKTASEKLIELGYQNVYDFGGIIDWPYDVEK